jgi:hypothetical protein
MENTVNFSCNLATTDSTVALGLEIWLDDQQIFDQEWIKDSQLFNYEFLDDVADHELRFVLKNKKIEHTQIEESGLIVKDSCLVISDLAFDEIKLGHIAAEQAVYLHDFNGTGPTTQNKFYGQMGCNGTVSLKFTTPLHVWLFKNM